eukprot:12769562-Alexandrium_andersonii.AAC.1
MPTLRRLPPTMPKARRPGGRRRAPSRSCRRTSGSGRNGRQCLTAPRRATPRPQAARNSESERARGRRGRATAQKGTRAPRTEG